MSDAEPKQKFRVSIGSVCAGLMFFGGCESFVRLCRDPIVHGVIHLLNRFGKAALHQAQRPDWVLMSANFAVGVIFFILAILVGARRLRRQVPAAS